MKVRESNHSLHNKTHCLALKHIDIKFHQDIPYNYLFMMHKILVWKIIKMTLHVSLKMEEQSFLYETSHLNFINIDIHHTGKYDLAVNQYLNFWIF